MQPRYAIEVTVLSDGYSLHSKTGTITPIFDPETKQLTGYCVTNDAGAIVAQCVSAKRLADWSYAQGAQSLSWPFDLKLCEDEL